MTCGSWQTPHFLDQALWMFSLRTLIPECKVSPFPGRPLTCWTNLDGLSLVGNSLVGPATGQGSSNTQAADIVFINFIFACVQTVYLDEMARFQVGEDSPVFSNMFKYCQVDNPGFHNMFKYCQVSSRPADCRERAWLAVRSG